MRGGSDRLLAAIDAESAACRTQSWLEEVFCEAERSTPPRAEAICSGLLGSWFCNHLIGRGHAPLFPEIAPRAYKLLRAHGSRSYFSPVAPTLRLIVAALLKAEGLIVESLEEFVLRSADVLQRSSPDHSAEGLGMMEKQVLLHRMGLCQEPDLVGLDEVLNFADSLPLPASRDGVEEFLLLVEGWTGWGTHSVSLPASEVWLLDMLRGFAGHFFRQYDLSMGCGLLRALCHVDWSPATTQLATFVLLQQRVEGSFGFLGLEAAELESLAPGVNVDLLLSLPITVECLWALSEASANGWRLFDRLP